MPDGPALALGPWVAPLLLIPGMALLAISTGNRYGQLQLYLVEKREQARPRSVPELPALYAQLTSLHRALLALYVGIAVDGVAALLGGLLSGYPAVATPLVVVLSCLGVALLVVASGILSLEMLRGGANDKPDNRMENL